jgi:hypothetical protein
MAGEGANSGFLGSAKDTVQKQAQLNNQSITDNYKRIERFYSLADKEVENPRHGMKLEVIKKNSIVHFKLKGHKYRLNHEQKMTGYATDALTITFNGGKLSRLERIYYDKEFANQQSLVVRIVDPDPSTPKHNNILISRTKNGQTKIRSRFGDIKNTPANPHRNKLKNAYVEYLKDLLFVLNRISFETEKREKKRSKEAIKDFPSVLSY